MVNVMNEPKYLDVEIAKGNLCYCGHHGREHAGTEPRVCKVISCKCYQFSKQNPYAEDMHNIDRFVREFKTFAEKFDWLCKEMPFLYGLNDTEIIFWYWKYVYPLWDPETEFMTPEVKTAIQSNAKPSVVSRGFRKHREMHPEEKNKYKNLVLWQSYKEAGYREAAVNDK